MIHKGQQWLKARRTINIKRCTFPNDKNCSNCLRLLRRDLRMDATDDCAIRYDYDVIYDWTLWMVSDTRHCKRVSMLLAIEWHTRDSSLIVHQLKRYFVLRILGDDESRNPDETALCKCLETKTVLHCMSGGEYCTVKRRLCETILSEGWGNKLLLLYVWCGRY